MTSARVLANAAMCHKHSVNHHPPDLFLAYHRSHLSKERAVLADERKTTQIKRHQVALAWFAIVACVAGGVISKPCISAVWIGLPRIESPSKAW